MTTTTEQQYVREWVGPFTHLWFDPAPAFRPSQTDCKEKNRSIFSECSDPPRGGACAPQEKIHGQRERANQPPLPLRCHLSLALATSVATSCFANRQTSVSICRRLKSPFLNEFFCNDHWRAHRRGGFTFWPQV